MTKKEYMLQEMIKDKTIRGIYDECIIKAVPYEEWVAKMMNSLLKDCAPKQWEELLKPIEPPPTCDACGRVTKAFTLKIGGDRWCKKCMKQSGVN